MSLAKWYQGFVWSVTLNSSLHRKYLRSSSSTVAGNVDDEQAITRCRACSLLLACDSYCSHTRLWLPLNRWINFYVKVSQLATVFAWKLWKTIRYHIGTIFDVLNRKRIGQESRRPANNARWRNLIFPASHRNFLQWRMIRPELAVSTIKILMKSFNCPFYCQGF